MEGVCVKYDDGSVLPPVPAFLVTPSFGLTRGTTIPLPQCGHSATWPRSDSSAITCCPHCGHLNSKFIVLFSFQNHLPRLPYWMLSLRRGRNESGAPSKSRFVEGAAKNLNEKQERGHAACVSRDAPSYPVLRCGKLAALPRNPIRCCVACWGPFGLSQHLGSGC